MKSLLIFLFSVLALCSCATQSPVDGQSAFPTRSQMQIQDDIMAVHRENLRRTSWFF